VRTMVPTPKLVFQLAILFTTLIAASLLCLPSALGQTGSASVSGRVTDQSNAVVPDAEIQMRNVDTNVTQVTKTNGDGIYVFPSLAPGNFLMNVRKQSFRTVSVTGIELHTQDSLERNFVLQVGSSAESVTVSANAEHMETDNPAVGVLVNRDFVENLPLNGRSFQDLIALAPGTVSSANDQGVFSINGQRDDTNYYSIDGVGAPTNPNYNTENVGVGLSGTAPGQTAIGTTQNLVSVDALEEFRIQTSSYDAAYGRQPGGQVEFRTRSGTNVFHGTLFDYFRNEAMDANSYFNNLDGIPRQQDRQNDFGGTFGGPVKIPRVYDGKDHTFFFFSYEGLRLHSPFFVGENEPTVAFRQGAAVGVQPFLNAFPIPNGPANSDGLTAQFHDGISEPSSFDAVSVRVDHSLNQKVQIFGRYANTPSQFSQYGVGGTFSVGAVNTQTVTLGATASLSTRLSDELRFNYTSVYAAANLDRTDLGGAVPFSSSLLIPSQYAGVSPRGYFSLSDIPGIAGYVPGLSVGTLGSTQQHQINLVDTIAWTRGSHSLKFGGDWRRLFPTWGLATYLNELFFTSLSGVQQGLANIQAVGQDQVVKPVFDNVSIFVQDHWRVVPRLTVDFGVRWEFNPVPGASNGKYPLAVTQISDLATMQLAPEGTSLYSTSYDHFAPRLGFAYQLIPSTNHALVIRAGGGIFYDTAQNLAQEGYNGYPFTVYVINSNVALPLQASSFVPPSLDIPLTPPYGNLNGLSDPHLTLPYTEQWSVSLDQQLSSRNTLTVSYVGNEGHKLLYTEDYSNLGAVNPNFTSAQITDNGAASNYNALQVQDQGYVAPGLQVVASYTLAHARDSSSIEGPIGFPATWGNSDNDIRHMFNLATNYQIPSKQDGNRFLRSLTKGWLLSNRFEALSGYPFTVIQGQSCNPVSAACAEFFPNLVTGVPIYEHNVPNVPGGWQLNPNAFSPVPTDPNTGVPLTMGTLGRNFLHGPGFWNLNTSVERNFSLYERLSLAFRVDAFNVFNHPNFAGVDNFLGDATFGQPLGSAIINGFQYGTGTARTLQVSLKLHF